MDSQTQTLKSALTLLVAFTLISCSGHAPADSEGVTAEDSLSLNGITADTPEMATTDDAPTASSDTAPTDGLVAESELVSEPIPVAVTSEAVPAKHKIRRPLAAAAPLTADSPFEKPKKSRVIQAAPPVQQVEVTQPVKTQVETQVEPQIAVTAPAEPINQPPVETAPTAFRSAEDRHPTNVQTQNNPTENTEPPQRDYLTYVAVAGILFLICFLFYRMRKSQ